MEGILWLKVTDKLTSQNPVHLVGEIVQNNFYRLSWGPNYRNLGTVCICGNFKAICGNLTEIPSRKVLDMEQNSHGKQFIVLLKFCTLNGRVRITTHTSQDWAAQCLITVIQLEEFNTFYHFSWLLIRK